jgi:hypothetical protein
MLKLFLVSDPKRPSLPAIALAQNEDQERALRDNVARQNLVCGPGRLIKPSGDFWRFQGLVRKQGR